MWRLLRLYEYCWGLIPANFTHLRQECVIDIGTILRLTKWLWSNPDENEKIRHTNPLGTHIKTTTKALTHNIFPYSMRNTPPAYRLFTQPFIQGANQRKHQSSASLAFVRGIHWSPVTSPHQGPVTRKTFPFDDGIMIYFDCTACYDSSCNWWVRKFHRIKSTSLNSIMFKGTCELRALLWCDAQLRQSWWLQVLWCLIGTTPSGTSMLTLLSMFDIILQIYHIRQHTYPDTVIKQTVPERGWKVGKPFGNHLMITYISCIPCVNWCEDGIWLCF